MVSTLKRNVISNSFFVKLETGSYIDVEKMMASNVFVGNNIESAYWSSEEMFLRHASLKKTAIKTLETGV